MWGLEVGSAESGEPREGLHLMGALTESHSAIKNSTGAWRLGGNNVHHTLSSGVRPLPEMIPSRN